MKQIYLAIDQNLLAELLIIQGRQKKIFIKPQKKIMKMIIDEMFHNILT